MSSIAITDYDPRIPIEKRRSLSPLLANFPWQWEGVTQAPQSLRDYADAIPEFRTFISNLHHHESLLFGFHGPQASADTLRTLGIELRYPEDLASKSSINVFQPGQLTVSQYMDLCSLIFNYRFFETIALRKKLVTPLSLSPTLPRLRLPPLKINVQKEELHGFKKLTNWIGLLYEFKALVEKNDKKFKDPKLPLPKDPVTSLMRMLSENEERGDYTRIESNFLQAALHVNAMRSIMFPAHVVPDLPPEDMGTLSYQPANGGGDDGAAPAEDDSGSILYQYSFRNQGEKSSSPPVTAVAKRRAPLHLAILISPLFLALQFVLTKKSFNRRLLLDLSARLGPHKPPLLLQIEELFLTALFVLSRGRTLPHLVLMDLVKRIPWDALDRATELEKLWFSVDDRPILTTSSTSVQFSAHITHHEVDKSVDCLQTEAGFQKTWGSLSVTSLRNEDGSSSQVTHSGQAFPSSEPPGPRDGGHVALTDEGEMGDLSLASTAAEQDGVERPEEGSGQAPSSTGPPEPLEAEMEPAYGDGDQAELMDGLAAVSMADPLAQTYYQHIDKDMQIFDGEVANQKSAQAIVNIEADSDLSDLTISSDEEASQRGQSAEHKEKLKQKTKNGTSKPLRKTSPHPKNSSNRRAQPLESAKEPTGGAAVRKRGPSPHVPSDHASDAPVDVDLITSLYNPIAADETYVIKEEISFSDACPPARERCNTQMTAYDAEGKEWKFIPEFHFKIHIARFKQFYARVQAGYIEGVPRFIKKPDLSCIKILSWALFQELSTAELSAIMTKHVLVTGCPYKKGMKFDAVGLRLLAPLSAQRAITDFSQFAPTAPKEVPCTPAVVSGRVQDILHNTLTRNKILNGLDFPLWKSRDTNNYSVDLAAWDYVRGLQSSDINPSFPTEHMSWATAGGQHVLTFLHIDSDGLGTEDGPHCGAKYWGVLSPDQSLPLSSIYFFLDRHFRLNEVVNDSKYSFEAVVLRPGDRFYMKPGTPHFVYGLQDAICFGSHHYVTALMQETLHGLIHAFVLHKFLTNTQHPPTRQLLRKTLIFYQMGTMLGQVPTDDPTFEHLPNIQAMEGIVNILSVAILCLLGNVLDFRTYNAPNQHADAKRSKEQSYLLQEDDVNNIPFDERVAICYARGVALHVLRWINRACVFKDKTGAPVSHLPFAYVIQILGALLSYKKAAKKLGLDGAPHCTYDLLLTQVNNVVECDLDLEKLWSARSPEEPVTSLAFESKDRYTVEWRTGWEEEWRKQDPDYLYDGMTPRDYKYFATLQERSRKEDLRVAGLIPDKAGPSKKRKIH